MADLPQTHPYQEPIPVPPPVKPATDAGGDTLPHGGLVVLPEPFLPTYDPPQTGADAVPAAIAVEPPPRIPGYEILGELGRGGMGVVYKARQEKINRLVALKMVLGSRFARPEDRVRFLLEGEVLGRVQHPNIVQIYEVDTCEGQPFFALEYVEGGNLAEYHKREPLSTRAAAALVETLARAMHYAHCNGVIHRDLKPANILVASRASHGPDSATTLPLAKITDFGLAKQMEVGTGLTATGALMGTPAYMAPEQADRQARHVTPATDVYALGAILYELLAGRPPFVGDNLWDVLRQVLELEPPSLRSLQQSIPRDLATICHKCLEKDPAKRYPTAEALADDLHRFLDDQAISARSVTRGERAIRWCRRNKVVAASLTSIFLVMAMGTIVALLFARHAYEQEQFAQGEKLRADEKARDASREATVASKERNEARRLLGLQATREGLRHADQGDYYTALLWFVEALIQDPDNREAEAITRERFAAYRYYSNAPTLTQVLAHEGTINHTVFSPDGIWALTASSDKTARVWDAATGLPRTPPLRHQAPVNCATFSADGRWVGTASKDGTARVWDAATGVPRTPPLSHQAEVCHAAFSPDGRWVITASWDRTARIWDTATGHPRTPPLIHQAQLTYAAFSLDGRWVITGSRDGTVLILDAITGQPRIPPLRHQFSVMHVALSPDGRWLAVASGLKAQIWDTTNGQLRTPHMLHLEPVMQVAFSPDGRWVVTTSADRNVWIWDAATGVPRTPPLRHRAAVNSAAFSPDGRWVVSASEDGTARVWDAATGVPRTPPLSHQAEVCHAAFSPDGRWVITASRDRTARIWDTATGQPRSPPLIHQGPVINADFSPNNNWLATASGDKTARVWDTISGLPKLQPLRHDGLIIRVAFSADGCWIGTASWDGTARVWNAATGVPHTPPLRHGAAVNYVAFSPDGRWVGTASKDGTARVWDADTGEPRTPPLYHNFHVEHVAFSSDGRWVVTASADKTARVWDAATGVPRTPPLSHQDVVNRAVFSPNCRWVATASSDKTARVWDAATGAPVTSALVHQEGVICVAFSPNDRLVVSASWDGTARIWDPATGIPKTPQLENKDDLTHAAFSSDSRKVVTASIDNIARVWDATTGLPITPPLVHEDKVMHAAFSPNDRWVVTASLDNSARVWPQLHEKRPARDLLTHIQVLGGYRIVETGGLQSLSVDQLLISWQTIHTKYPDEFRVSPAVARQWRQEQIAECMKSGNLHGALLHRDWMIVEAIREKGQKIH